MAPILPQNYKPLPTSERESSEDKELKPYPNSYDLSTLALDSETHTRLEKAETRRKRKTIHLIFVALFVFLYMAFFIGRAMFPMSSRRGLTASTRKQCIETMHHLLGNVKGVSRNMSSKASTLPTHYTLPSGDRIPSVALGVWKAGLGEVGPAVKTALNAGYRHIDGAWIYGNEAEVGEAVKSSGVPRGDIWITSKLWNSFHQPSDVEAALDESLSRLQTNYLDLYLMHWPVAFRNNGKEFDVDFELTENPYPTWKKLEEMVEKGKVRNIGVSNFNIRRIQNLTANALKIKPAVNQVELNYWNPQPELVKWAKDNGLVLEAYSPLGSEGKVKESLEIPEVKKIAKELGITPAQVYISWHVQRGTVVLPKSVTPSRIEANLQVVSLPQAAFDLLEKAAISHKPLRTVDPTKRWGVDVWS